MGAKRWQSSARLPVLAPWRDARRWSLGIWVKDVAESLQWHANKIIKGPTISNAQVQVQVTHFFDCFSLLTGTEYLYHFCMVRSYERRPRSCAACYRPVLPLHRPAQLLLAIPRTNFALPPSPIPSSPVTIMLQDLVFSAWRFFSRIESKRNGSFSMRRVMALLWSAIANLKRRDVLTV